MLTFFSIYRFVPSAAKAEFAASYLGSRTAKDRKHLINREINLKVPSEYVGSGNAAQRRQGIDTNRTGCDCTVCVVYGGDCASTMHQEWADEYHRSLRGVKTKLSRQFPLSPR